jgi:chaperone modulatory protein CbpM
MKRYQRSEVVRRLGLEDGFVVECISHEWVRPAQREPVEEFDEEDVARMELIRELRESFRLNDEGVPVVLHLLDQVHFLRRQILRLQALNERSDGK